MTVRFRYWAAAVLGLWLAQPHLAHAASPPAEPGRLGAVFAAPTVNQKMADAIAGQLRQSAQLRHYSVDVVFHDGVAAVSGSVADQPQREEVLRIVQGVPGVERVLDRLSLANAVTPVRAEAPPATLPEPLAPQVDTAAPPPPAPGAAAVPPAGVVGPVTEAPPIFHAPAPSPYSLNPPKMPPYAWPTYAPYNNYSRVAYPEAYPYNAWPFIGPIYPFPKVPLGWRAVKLEWDDGHWWFSKVATKYDWWRLRFY